MADVTAVDQVVFHLPEDGATEAEWEDCAGYDPGDAARERPARYVVVDGAVEAYDSIRWVRQLVTSFLGMDGVAPPSLTPSGLDKWIELMQQRWLDEAPRVFASVFEEHKFYESGSFATFLGCEIHGLGGLQPQWSAAALGDAVLFHIRGERLIGHFPALSPEDFGPNPDGVFTRPSARARMRYAMRLASGALQVGDLLFLATDALAAWSIEASGLDESACWRLLTELMHPTDFRRFVAAERKAGRMRNDDVTLLRIEVTPAAADVLVVCR